jgi:hypothetical protein
MYSTRICILLRGYQHRVFTRINCPSTTWNHSNKLGVDLQTSQMDCICTLKGGVLKWHIFMRIAPSMTTKWALIHTVSSAFNTHYMYLDLKTIFASVPCRLSSKQISKVKKRCAKNKNIASSTFTLLSILDHLDRGRISVITLETHILSNMYWRRYMLADLVYQSWTPYIFRHPLYIFYCSAPF